VGLKTGCLLHVVTALAVLRGIEAHDLILFFNPQTDAFVQDEGDECGDDESVRTGRNYAD